VAATAPDVQHPTVLSACKRFNPPGATGI
jgi:hypothetical protein